MRVLLITAMFALVPTGATVADSTASTTPTAVSARGEEVYRTVCATCHDNPQTRAPNKAFLQQTRSSEYILRALTNGVMRDITAGVSVDDKKAVATYLIGRLPSAAAEVNPDANRCKASPPPLSLEGSNWNGWGGQGVTNARYHASPGLIAGEVPKLKLKWVFAYPGGVSSEPAVVGGRIFVSSMAGHLFALDARTGCTYWHVDVGIPARAMVTVGKMSGRPAVFVTDWQGHVYARDPDTGAEIWKTQVEDHRAVRLTGSPTLFEDRLYVPVSSGEEVLASDPKYACCTFRGSLVSLDSATGKIVWRAYTIDQAPRPLSDGKRMGPAGAAIWSAPTIDVKRRLVYVATGDDYSNPTTDASDAIIAYDLDTGKKRWTSQVFPNDAFIVGCDGATRHANCPEGKLGPDFDFGASPLLVQTAFGKDLIVALSKGGGAYGLDPSANGKILWQTRLGRGGLLGGVEWGGATDGQRLFVPIGDAATSAVAKSKADESFPMKPGLNAVSLDGKLLWHTPAPQPACSWQAGDCSNAFTAAALAIPGIVFAGSRDGHIRAFAADDGKLVWDFDTGRAFPAVNGGNAAGGSIDHGAQTIANGMLYVNSGGRQGQPGNALLAFSVDSK